MTHEAQILNRLEVIGELERALDLALRDLGRACPALGGAWHPHFLVDHRANSDTQWGVAEGGSAGRLAHVWRLHGEADVGLVAQGDSVVTLGEATVFRGVTRNGVEAHLFETRLRSDDVVRALLRRIADERTAQEDECRAVMRAARRAARRVGPSRGRAP